MDPMATAAIVGPMLANSSEAQAVAAVNAQIDAGNANLGALIQQAQGEKMAVGRPQQSTINKLNDQQSALDTLLIQLQGLMPALNERRSQLMTDFAQYSTPGSSDYGSENLCTEDQVLAYQAAAAPGLKVKLDGTTVQDSRGVKYWTVDASGNYASTEITKLGDSVPSGVTLDSALTDAQRATIAAQAEAARVAALTDAQRLAEAESAQSIAKAIVAQVQNEVTAGISTQAELTAALAIYQSALAALNAKYGTKLA